MIVFRTPGVPDIPESLSAFQKQFSLKQRDYEQLVQQAKVADPDGLVDSDFFKTHVETMKRIEEAEGKKENFLTGEALHHAAMIEAKRALRITALTTEKIAEGRSDTATAISAVCADPANR